MLLNNKKHIFLHVISFLGMAFGMLVPIYGTQTLQHHIRAEQIFNCPKNNAACAQALAELKKDFAEQQKIVVQLLKAEPYLTNLSTEEIAQRGCGVLKGLQSIKIERHADFIAVTYGFNRISGNPDTLLAQPYGAFLAPFAKALHKAMNQSFWTPRFLLKIVGAPTNPRYEATKAVLLDNAGSYVSLWWHIKYGGGAHFNCTGIIPLAQLQ